MYEKVKRLLERQNIHDRAFLQMIDQQDFEEFWQKSNQDQKNEVVKVVFSNTEKDEIRLYILDKLRNPHYREVLGNFPIGNLFKPKKLDKKKAEPKSGENRYEFQFSFVRDSFPGLFALFQTEESHLQESWPQLKDDAELIKALKKSKQFNPGIGEYVHAKLLVVLEIVRSLMTEQGHPQFEDAVRFLAAFMDDPQFAIQIQDWMTESLRSRIEELRVAGGEQEPSGTGGVVESKVLTGESLELLPLHDQMSDVRVETTPIPASPEGRVELLLELLKAIANEDRALDKKALTALMADELGRLWLNGQMRNLTLEDRFQLVNVNEKNGNLPEALRLLFDSVDDLSSLKQCLEQLKRNVSWYREWVGNYRVLTIAAAFRFEREKAGVLPFMREYRFFQMEELKALTNHGISLYEWLEYACEQLDGKELAVFLTSISDHPLLQSEEEIRGLARKLTDSGKIGGLRRLRGQQSFFWDVLTDESIRLLAERLNERSFLLEKERHQRENIQYEQVVSTAKALKEYCEQLQSRLVYYMGPSADSISADKIVNELVGFHASFIESLAEISVGHPNLRRLKLEPIVPVGGLGKEVEYQPDLHSFKDSYLLPGESCKVISLGMKYIDGEQTRTIWKATVESLQLKGKDYGDSV